MIAIQINPKVGRCESCRRFRNNMEWRVECEIESKVVCLDCFKTFKNQRLIDEVIPRVVEIKKQRKPKTTRPKSILSKPNYPNYVRKLPGEPRNSEIIKSNLLSHIKQAESPVSMKRLKKAKIASKNTLDKYIQELLNEREIRFIELGRRHYIDSKRYESFKNYRLPNGKYAARKLQIFEVVLNIIKDSMHPLTPSEINQHKLCTWNSKSVYPALAKLIESGKVVGTPITEVNSLYIDFERAYMLEEKINYAERNELLTDNARKILDFINSRNELTTNKDLVELTGVDKTTVIRITQDLKEKNLIRSTVYGGVKKRATVIAPLSNEELCRQVDEIEFNSTDKQLRRLMEAGGIYTVSQACIAIGRNRGSNGSRKFIKNLLIEWGCKTVKEGGRGIGYYLEKVEGQQLN